MTSFDQLLAAANRAAQLWDDPAAQHHLSQLCQCDLMFVLAVLRSNKECFAEVERVERLVTRIMQANGMLASGSAAPVKGG